MRSRMGKFLGWLGVLAAMASVLVYVLPTLGRLVGQVGARFHDFRWPLLAAAFALSVGVRPINAFAWRTLLAAAYGYRLPWGKAIRIWLLGESCRWLPGGVWHYASRTGQATALGVPAAVAITSMALELLLLVIATLTLAVIAMLTYGTQSIAAEGLASKRTLWIAAIGLGVVLAAIGAGLVTRYFFPHRYRTLQDRLAALRQIRPRKLPTAACLVFYLFFAVLNGLAFYATVLAIRPHGDIPLLAAIAANAVAWVAGLLAVTSAGIGVREAALTMQLTVWLSLGDAILIAVLWRLLLVGVELVCVAIACALPLIIRGQARCAGPPAQQQTLGRS